MATKRSLNQDPEYEAIPSEIQEKRIKLMEDNVRNHTKKKIESIIKSNFEQEIAAKDAEIDAIDEHLYECRAMLDRLRACIITKYYATLGQEQMPSENSAPSIHPTVKKFLGKTPRFTSYSSTEVANDNNENAFTNSSKAPVIENYSNSNDLPSSQNVEKVGTEFSCSDKNDDIPTRAPRFKTKAKIIVGNISNFIPIWKREDQSTHRWMVYVRGDKDSPNIESFVKKVRFLLHPSYRPTDVIEISNPPFHLKKYGWGEFPVRVQLHFHDPRNKPVDIIHNLKLDKTFTGLQTLGAETVVELQLFKQDDKMTVPSALPLATESSSICEVHQSQRNYHNLSSNGTNVLENETSAEDKIAVKIEVDTDCSVRSPELPTCVKNEVEDDTISNDNGNILANISGDNEKQQCLISEPIIANNRSVLSKTAVPSTSLNNTSVNIAPKPKVIPNGVNTTYVKCTDAEGRVLLVPQSSLLCIKSDKLNVSKLTSNIPGSNISPCIKPVSETLTNSNATLPSYILKFVPDQDSGQNQVFLIPVTEKKVQCTETNLLPKVKKENLVKSTNSLEKSQIISKGEIPVKSSKPDIDWEEELDQIKLDYYKTFVELLKRVCKIFPIVKKDVDRSVFPFCASSIEEFQRWNIGKQRASEWRRAGMVRTAILNLLNKKVSSHLNVDSIWSRKAIMSWCRKNGFVPMTSEKMTLLPEPKWSGIELCSVTSADDLLSTLKEENNSKLVSSDDEEIEIVEVVNKTKQVLNNQSQLQASHLPYLNEAAIYVKEVASQINVNLKPIEIESSAYAPAIEEMILAEFGLMEYLLKLPDFPYFTQIERLEFLKSNICIKLGISPLTDYVLLYQWSRDARKLLENASIPCIKFTKPHTLIVLCNGWKSEVSKLKQKIKELLKIKACKALASDLIGSAVNEGFNRLGGKLCPEEITVSDVYSTIMKTPQFDFLTNSYLGVPKDFQNDI